MLIEEEGCSFGLRDRVRLGDGVFDTMLCVDGQLVFPEAHIKRFARHASVLSLPLPYAPVRLIEAAQEVLARNDIKSGPYAINTVVTRGVSKRGLMPTSTPDVSVMIFASPLPKNSEPLHVIVARNVRRNEGSPLSNIKSCNYGDNILALLEARDKGANDALMLNNAGNAACFTSGNVYVMLQSQLYTPPLPDGAMDGIIRARLIAQNHVIEQTLSEHDLLKAQGIYLSNSIRGVQAVSTFEGKSLAAPSLDIDPALYIA